MIHDTAHGRDDGHFLFFHQFLQYTDPLLYQKIALHIGTVKDQIFCRIKQHIFIKQAIIFTQFFCTQFTVCDDQFLFCRPCCIDKVCFLGIDTSCHWIDCFFSACCIF